MEEARLQPINPTFWLAFCKTQDDKTLQMAKISFEQVQGILLLTALSDLRTSGKSLDTKAQESCILESYKTLAALWVNDGSDFQYRCIYPKIVSQLKDSCLNEGKSLLAKAKRIKKELTKVYAHYYAGNSLITYIYILFLYIHTLGNNLTKSGEQLGDQLLRFNTDLKLHLGENKDPQKYNNYFIAFCWFGPNYNPVGLDDEQNSTVSSNPSSSSRHHKNTLPSGKPTIPRAVLRVQNSTIKSFDDNFILEMKKSNIIDQQAEMTKNLTTQLEAKKFLVENVMTDTAQLLTEFTHALITKEEYVCIKAELLEKRRILSEDIERLMGEIAGAGKKSEIIDDKSFRTPTTVTTTSSVRTILVQADHNESDDDSDGESLAVYSPQDAQDNTVDTVYVPRDILCFEDLKTLFPDETVYNAAVNLLDICDTRLFAVAVPTAFVDLKVNCIYKGYHRMDLANESQSEVISLCNDSFFLIVNKIEKAASSTSSRSANSRSTTSKVKYQILVYEKPFVMYESTLESGVTKKLKFYEQVENCESTASNNCNNNGDDEDDEMVDSDDDADNDDELKIFYDKLAKMNSDDGDNHVASSSAIEVARSVEAAVMSEPSFSDDDRRLYVNIIYDRILHKDTCHKPVGTIEDYIQEIVIHTSPSKLHSKKRKSSGAQERTRPVSPRKAKK